YSGSEDNLGRSVILMSSGARLMVLDGDESAVGAFTSTNPDDSAKLASGKFKLVISSTLGNGFTNTDSNPGVKILTASLNPDDTDYYAKILNRDPDRFVQDQHLVYADFAVDDEVATPSVVGVLSGSTKVSLTS